MSFEFRDKLTDPRWRRGWKWATIVGSALIPLLIGVGLGDLLHGLPIDSSHEYTGNFFDLLTPYGLWTGVTLLILSLLHGATFLMLKTTGDVRARSAVAARILVWPSLGAILGFVIWTRAISGDALPEHADRARRARRARRRLLVHARAGGPGVRRLGGRDRRLPGLDLRRRCIPT